MRPSLMPILLNKIKNSLFWLTAGRTWRDRVRILFYWLSPYLLGAQANATPERPGPPVPFATSFRREPIYLRWNSTDARVLRFIFYNEAYNLSHEITGPVKTVVDLGSNIGLSVLYFADRYPGSTILAVEPDMASFECLEYNVRSLVEESRVQICQACVSDTSGNVWFNTQGPSWAHSLADSPEQGVQVDSFSMTDLFDRYNIDTIDLLKMDVEGAEKLIFESVNKWINRVKWIIMEIHFTHMSLQELSTILDRVGRCAYYKIPFSQRHWESLDNLIPSEIVSLDGLDLMIPPPGVTPIFPSN